MRTRRATYIRFLVTFAIVGTVGIAASVYVLVKERAPLPFQNVYTLRADFAAADGVVSGQGQPVLVVGVKVGQVTGVSLRDGAARVEMQIHRDQVPHIYRDAAAILEPKTPLKDMQVALDPGHPAAGLLTSGDDIPVANTRPPVPLSDLLSVLDGDTRAFLTSLIAGLDQGTHGRAPDMRRMLIALGPTVHDIGELDHSLARRRRALAHLVHDLALVMTAGSQDGQMATVVKAGNQALQAVTDPETPLRESIAKLPATLSAARATLARLQPFASQLGPSLQALLPGVRRLPVALSALKPFTDLGTRTLRDDLRPFVSAAKPLLHRAAPAVADLQNSTPDLTTAAQVLEYLVNELAYNPQGHDEGFLFWVAWAVHNLGSTSSTGDAHGAIVRATTMAQCDGLQEDKQLKAILGVVGLCPP